MLAGFGSVNMVVPLVKGSVGLDQVDNTSDVNKPVSTAQNTYIAQQVQNAINAIRNGVDPAGDTLTELYTLILAKASAAELANAITTLKGTADVSNDSLGELQNNIASAIAAIKGTADANNDSLGELQTNLQNAVTNLIGTADSTSNTLGKLQANLTTVTNTINAYLVSLVGTADANGNTLGKLQATDAANLKIAKKKAIAYAIALS
jgi:hypothetical protein